MGLGCLKYLCMETCVCKWGYTRRRAYAWDARVGLDARVDAYSLVRWRCVHWKHGMRASERHALKARVRAMECTRRRVFLWALTIHASDAHILGYTRGLG